MKIPIYKLLDEMPYEELVGWFNYFERRPVDWRSDDRTMKVLQTQGVKEKPWSIFPSLKAIYNADNGEKNPTTTLRNSSLFTKMLGAVGGDKLDL